MATASVPALTTVHMPVSEIVATGVEMCLGPGASTLQADGRHVILEPWLIVRKSSAAPAGHQDLSCGCASP